jgi:hypothetical protein
VLLLLSIAGLALLLVTMRDTLTLVLLLLLWSA